MDKNTNRNAQCSSNRNNDLTKVQKPIFVTGAPRSGLGIIHQILTSHYQVTSITSNSRAYEPTVVRLLHAKCRPAMTLLEVSRLAFSELMVEIDGTAIQ